MTNWLTDTDAEDVDESLQGEWLSSSEEQIKDEQDKNIKK